MNAIRLNLHVIQKLIDQHDSTRDHADDIVRETVLEMERIDGLLQALLNYARPERSHNESVAVGEEVRGVISFLQPIFDRNDVSIDASIADEPLIAHLDRARLRQIALNILKNALEAVGPGGVVHVKVDRQGSSVELVVADDGPGILAGDVSRIFEPFYTTKEMGTGLGMTLVKRYVEEAGGTIVYRPGEPRGAVFVVKLPMFGDVPTDEHSVPAPTVTA